MIRKISSVLAFWSVFLEEGEQNPLVVPTWESLRLRGDDLVVWVVALALIGHREDLPRYQCPHFGHKYLRI